MRTEFKADAKQLEEIDEVWKETTDTCVHISWQLSETLMRTNNIHNSPMRQTPVLPHHKGGKTKNRRVSDNERNEGIET